MTKLKTMSDSSLFIGHDIVNLSAFMVLLALPYLPAELFTDNYNAAKFLHLTGLLWFYGGLIVATFCLSRFVWTQPELDHGKLAYGYRAILLLELWCIPSVALLAFGGMAMVHQIGGLDLHRWAYHGYLFLLATPPILMAIPRFYHKRLINNSQLNLMQEQRKARIQDWLFILLMSGVILAISASMMWKTALL